ncbi:hypothetical protein ABL78_5971 [Leptomonas seymouri]|uniref:Uncharacterized protein n=1 Tax=Leptomonas seymouri TaxID=5684 RepID=A0A0N1PBA7_LEPSE|nr:hypothetical protein ABL78_5971 [Leptomonas seymouri]|eukprot:KPI84980.1 hypothetical protein ABL78_5971 [Leptomonas seymouri]
MPVTAQQRQYSGEGEATQPEPPATAHHGARAGSDSAVSTPAVPSSASSHTTVLHTVLKGIVGCHQRCPPRHWRTGAAPHAFRVRSPVEATLLLSHPGDVRQPEARPLLHVGTPTPPAPVGAEGRMTSVGSSSNSLFDNASALWHSAPLLVRSPPPTASQRSNKATCVTAAAASAAAAAASPAPLPVRGGQTVRRGDAAPATSTSTSPTTGRPVLPAQHVHMTSTAAGSALSGDVLPGSTAAQARSSGCPLKGTAQDSAVGPALAGSGRGGDGRSADVDVRCHTARSDRRSPPAVRSSGGERSAAGRPGALKAARSPPAPTTEAVATVAPQRSPMVTVCTAAGVAGPVMGPAWGGSAAARPLLSTLQPALFSDSNARGLRAGTRRSRRSSSSSSSSDSGRAYAAPLLHTSRHRRRANGGGDGDGDGDGALIGAASSPSPSSVAASFRQLSPLSLYPKSLCCSASPPHARPPTAETADDGTGHTPGPTGAASPPPAGLLLTPGESCASLASAPPFVPTRGAPLQEADVQGALADGGSTASVRATGGDGSCLPDASQPNQLRRLSQGDVMVPPPHPQAEVQRSEETSGEVASPSTSVSPAPGNNNGGGGPPSYSAASPAVPLSPDLRFDSTPPAKPTQPLTSSRSAVGALPALNPKEAAETQELSQLSTPPFAGTPSAREAVASATAATATYVRQGSKTPSERTSAEAPAAPMGSPAPSHPSYLSTTSSLTLPPCCTTNTAAAKQRSASQTPCSAPGAELLKQLRVALIDARSVQGHLEELQALLPKPSPTGAASVCSHRSLGAGEEQQASRSSRATARTTAPRGIRDARGPDNSGQQSARDAAMLRQGSHKTDWYAGEDLRAPTTTTTSAVPANKVIEVGTSMKAAGRPAAEEERAEHPSATATTAVPPAFRVGGLYTPSLNGYRQQRLARLTEQHLRSLWQSTSAVAKSVCGLPLTRCVRAAVLEDVPFVKKKALASSMATLAKLANPPCSRAGVRPPAVESPPSASTPDDSQPAPLAPLPSVDPSSSQAVIGSMVTAPQSLQSSPLSRAASSPPSSEREGVQARQHTASFRADHTFQLATRQRASTSATSDREEGASQKPSITPPQHDRPPPTPPPTLQQAHGSGGDGSDVAMRASTRDMAAPRPCPTAATATTTTTTTTLTVNTKHNSMLTPTVHSPSATEATSRSFNSSSTILIWSCLPDYPRSAVANPRVFTTPVSRTGSASSSASFDATASNSGTIFVHNSPTSALSGLAANGSPHDVMVLGNVMSSRGDGGEGGAGSWGNNAILSSPVESSVGGSNFNSHGDNRREGAVGGSGNVLSAPSSPASPVYLDSFGGNNSSSGGATTMNGVVQPYTLPSTLLAQLNSQLAHDTQQRSGEAGSHGSGRSRYWSSGGGGSEEVGESCGRRGSAELLLALSSEKLTEALDGAAASAPSIPVASTTAAPTATATESTVRTTTRSNPALEASKEVGSSEHHHLASPPNQHTQHMHSTMQKQQPPQHPQSPPSHHQLPPRYSLNPSLHSESNPGNTALALSWSLPPPSPTPLPHPAAAGGSGTSHPSTHFPCVQSSMEEGKAASDASYPNTCPYNSGGGDASALRYSPSSPTSSSVPNAVGSLSAAPALSALPAQPVKAPFIKVQREEVAADAVPGLDSSVSVSVVRRAAAAAAAAAAGIGALPKSGAGSSTSCFSGSRSKTPQQRAAHDDSSASAALPSHSFDSDASPQRPRGERAAAEVEEGRCHRDAAAPLECGGASPGDARRGSGSATTTAIATSANALHAGTPNTAPLCCAVMPPIDFSVLPLSPYGLRLDEEMTALPTIHESAESTVPELRGSSTTLTSSDASSALPELSILDRSQSGSQSGGATPCDAVPGGEVRSNNGAAAVAATSRAPNAAAASVAEASHEHPLEELEVLASSFTATSADPMTPADHAFAAPLVSVRSNIADIIVSSCSRGDHISAHTGLSVSKESSSSLISTPQQASTSTSYPSPRVPPDERVTNASSPSSETGEHGLHLAAFKTSEESVCDERNWMPWRTRHSAASTPQESASCPLPLQHLSPSVGRASGATATLSPSPTAGHDSRTGPPMSSPQHLPPFVLPLRATSAVTAASVAGAQRLSAPTVPDTPQPPARGGAQEGTAAAVETLAPPRGSSVVNDSLEEAAVAESELAKETIAPMRPSERDSRTQTVHPLQSVQESSDALHGHDASAAGSSPSSPERPGRAKDPAHQQPPHTQSAKHSTASSSPPLVLSEMAASTVPVLVAAAAAVDATAAVDAVAGPCGGPLPLAAPLGMPSSAFVCHLQDDEDTVATIVRRSTTSRSEDRLDEDGVERGDAMHAWSAGSSGSDAATAKRAQVLASAHQGHQQPESSASYSVSSSHPRLFAEDQEVGGHQQHLPRVEVSGCRQDGVQEEAKGQGALTDTPAQAPAAMIAVSGVCSADPSQASCRDLQAGVPPPPQGTSVDIAQVTGGSSPAVCAVSRSAGTPLPALAEATTELDDAPAGAVTTAAAVAPASCGTVALFTEVEFNAASFAKRLPMDPADARGSMTPPSPASAPPPAPLRSARQQSSAGSMGEEHSSNGNSTTAVGVPAAAAAAAASGGGTAAADTLSLSSVSWLPPGAAAVHAVLLMSSDRSLPEPAEGGTQSSVAASPERPSLGGGSVGSRYGVDKAAGGGRAKAAPAEVSRTAAYVDIYFADHRGGSMAELWAGDDMQCSRGSERAANSNDDDDGGGSECMQKSRASDWSGDSSLLLVRDVRAGGQAEASGAPATDMPGQTRVSPPRPTVYVESARQPSSENMSTSSADSNRGGDERVGQHLVEGDLPATAAAAAHSSHLTTGANGSGCTSSTLGHLTFHTVTPPLSPQLKHQSPSVLQFSGSFLSVSSLAPSLSTGSIPTVTSGALSAGGAAGVGGNALMPTTSSTLASTAPTATTASSTTVSTVSLSGAQIGGGPAEGSAATTLANAMTRGGGAAAATATAPPPPPPPPPPPLFTAACGSSSYLFSSTPPAATAAATTNATLGTTISSPFEASSATITLSSASVSRIFDCTSSTHGLSTSPVVAVPVALPPFPLPHSSARQERHASGEMESTTSFVEMATAGGGGEGMPLSGLPKGVCAAASQAQTPALCRLQPLPPLPPLPPLQNYPFPLLQASSRDDEDGGDDDDDDGDDGKGAQEVGDDAVRHSRLEDRFVESARSVLDDTQMLVEDTAESVESIPGQREGSKGADAEAVVTAAPTAVPEGPASAIADSNSVVSIRDSGAETNALGTHLTRTSVARGVGHPTTEATHSERVDGDRDAKEGMGAQADGDHHRAPPPRPSQLPSSSSILEPIPGELARRSADSEPSADPTAPTTTRLEAADVMGPAAGGHAVAHVCALGPGGHSDSSDDGKRRTVAGEAEPVAHDGGRERALGERVPADDDGEQVESAADPHHPFRSADLPFQAALHLPTSTPLTIATSRNTDAAGDAPDNDASGGSAGGDGAVGCAESSTGASAGVGSVCGDASTHPCGPRSMVPPLLSSRSPRLHLASLLCPASGAFEVLRPTPRRCSRPRAHTASPPRRFPGSDANTLTAWQQQQQHDEPRNRYFHRSIYRRRCCSEKDAVYESSNSGGHSMGDGADSGGSAGASRHDRHSRGSCTRDGDASTTTTSLTLGRVSDDATPPDTSVVARTQHGQSHESPGSPLSGSSTDCTALPGRLLHSIQHQRFSLSSQATSSGELWTSLSPSMSRSSSSVSAAVAVRRTSRGTLNCNLSTVHGGLPTLLPTTSAVTTTTTMPAKAMGGAHLVTTAKAGIGAVVSAASIGFSLTARPPPPTSVLSVASSGSSHAEESLLLLPVNAATTPRTSGDAGSNISDVAEAHCEPVVGSTASSRPATRAIEGATAARASRHPQISHADGRSEVKVGDSTSEAGACLRGPAFGPRRGRTESDAADSSNAACVSVEEEETSRFAFSTLSTLTETDTRRLSADALNPQFPLADDRTADSDDSDPHESSSQRTANAGGSSRNPAPTSEDEENSEASSTIIVSEFATSIVDSTPRLQLPTSPQLPRISWTAVMLSAATSATCRCALNPVVGTPTVRLHDAVTNTEWTAGMEQHMLVQVRGEEVESPEESALAACQKPHAQSSRSNSVGLNRRGSADRCVEAEAEGRTQAASEAGEREAAVWPLLHNDASPRRGGAEVVAPSSPPQDHKGEGVATDGPVDGDGGGSRTTVCDASNPQLPLPPASRHEKTAEPASDQQASPLQQQQQHDLLGVLLVASSADTADEAEVTAATTAVGATAPPSAEETPGAAVALSSSPPVMRGERQVGSSTDTEPAAGYASREEKPPRCSDEAGAPGSDADEPVDASAEESEKAKDGGAAAKDEVQLSVDAVETPLMPPTAAAAAAAAAMRSRNLFSLPSSALPSHSASSTEASGTAAGGAARVGRRGGGEATEAAREPAAPSPAPASPPHTASLLRRSPSPLASYRAQYQNGVSDRSSGCVGWHATTSAFFERTTATTTSTTRAYAGSAAAEGVDCRSCGTSARGRPSSLYAACSALARRRALVQASYERAGATTAAASVVTVAPQTEGSDWTPALPSSPPLSERERGRGWWHCRHHV